MSALSMAMAGAALAFGAGAGGSACVAVQRLRRRARHRSQAGMQRASDAPDARGASALDAHVLALLERESISAAARARAPELPSILARSGWFERNAPFTGLAGSVSQQGFCALRLKLALAGALVGCALGAAVSGGLALVLGIVGCFLGFTTPGRALRHRVDRRTRQMEHHLPEMLDVVAIGMRSGLSFDRSVQIYASRFDTMLASELALAERKWASGLERRDQALRQLAATYDSPVLSRVMEAVVRALRFGTSMVDSLEAAAREARVAYRANRQEQVAKAPVKMMIPTGTLILPAMLIMVLGPVLLEMIGGGM